MVSYVTQSYDFLEAIRKHADYNDYYSVSINNTVIINDNMSILHTNIGKFFCESFEDKNGTVYMKVSTFI